MKKKVLAIMLSLVMVFTLAACGNGGNGGDTGESSAPEWKSYDEKIKAIRAETDLAKREALMHEAEDQLMSTWAVIPLYYYNDVYLQKKEVKNIYHNGRVKLLWSFFVDKLQCFLTVQYVSAFS